MIEILPMRSKHTDQVARLHLDNLQTPFRGRAGRELLTLYYDAVVVAETSAYGYVAISRDELVGYVCGVWDAHALRKTLLRDHWSHLVFWGLIQILGRPSLILDFPGRLRSDKPADISPAAMDDRSLYELRPIVVAPKMRGSGLGTQLITKLITDARSRGYHSMYLYTEDDNNTAQRLYEKNDFKEVGSWFRNGRYYLRFELDFSLVDSIHES